MTPMIWDSLPLRSRLHVLRMASHEATTDKARRLAHQEYLTLYYSAARGRRYLENMRRMLNDLPPMPIESEAA